MFVERPCNQCWHKGTSGFFMEKVCKHPAAEDPTGGTFKSRAIMRTRPSQLIDPVVNRDHCGPDGHFWLSLPGFPARIKYWFMSRRKKYQWAQAIERLLDKPVDPRQGAEAANMGQATAQAGSSQPSNRPYHGLTPPPSGSLLGLPGRLPPGHSPLSKRYP